MSQRELRRARVGWPVALRELKDQLYDVYLAADKPSLDAIVADLVADDDLPASPARDTIRRCLSEPSMPPSQADVVSIAAVLARRAAWDGGELTARLVEMWNNAYRSASHPAGDPIGAFDGQRVIDVLNVHRTFAPDDAGADAGTLPALPLYVDRPFDAQLRQVIDAAASGVSGVMMLVGGSSTGKTRACWESVRRLPADWRLWQPPSNAADAAAALEGLDSVAPRTVIWLNEAQNILASEQYGERFVAALKDLIHAPDRGPILVAGTLWPAHWELFSQRPNGTDVDQHLKVRELLDGHIVAVPDDFSEADASSLSSAIEGDPRVAQAVTRAEDSQITQYLAGVPVIMKRYDTAIPTAKALLHAAMDARRLGAGPNLPLAWLAEAAPGYLNDTQWNQTGDGDDWLAEALEHVTRPAKGIPGLLTRVRTDTARNRRPSANAATTATGDLPDLGPLFQLTDYLEQHGRKYRADVVPPVAFWIAAAAHAHASDRSALGHAARSRGLYRDAAQLYKNATTQGDTYAARELVAHFHEFEPSDTRPQQWVIDQVAVEDPEAVSLLIGTLADIGMRDQVTSLAERAAAGCDVDSSYGVGSLLYSLRENVPSDQPIATLARRVARTADVVHGRIEDPEPVTELLACLHEVGAHEQAMTLAERVASRSSLKNTEAVIGLLRCLKAIGAESPFTVLAERVIADLDWADKLMDVLEVQRAEGVTRDEETAPLDSPDAVQTLLDGLRRKGFNVRLASTIPEITDITKAAVEPFAAGRLLDQLSRDGMSEELAILAEGAARHCRLPHSMAASFLLNSLTRAGMKEQVAVLIERLPGAGCFDLFLAYGDHRAEFRFGMEPDRSPAPPWTWEDLL